jgi:UDP-N-acetylglucosamine 2-epimerase (non-hydrolysing)
MPLTISHVVGARPNFMKAAPVVLGLGALGAIQRLVHTGQHYSDELSTIFFRELDLPEPDVNLEVGSGSHGQQTGALMVALERELVAHRPGLLVVYGDVNSTLAASIVAAKAGVPVAHVEAGLRSFDRSMPEEINRVVTDALADTLLTTSPEAEEHLRSEGVNAERIHFVGNPMIDTLLRHRSRFDADRLRARYGLTGPYGVVTLHRPANVDDPVAAGRLGDAIRGLADLVPLVVPLHPRGRERLAAAGLVNGPAIQVVDPLGYIDFISLVSGAALVATDSGGIQEETTILGVPCLTLRPNTERPITISHGTNRLVEPGDLVAVAAEVLRRGPVAHRAPPLWDGQAGPRIAAILRDRLTTFASGGVVDAASLGDRPIRSVTV